MATEDPLILIRNELEPAQTTTKFTEEAMSKKSYKQHPLVSTKRYKYCIISAVLGQRKKKPGALGDEATPSVNRYPGQTLDPRASRSRKGKPTSGCIPFSGSPSSRLLPRRLGRFTSLAGPLHSHINTPSSMAP